MAEAVGQPVVLNALDTNNATPVQSAAKFIGLDGLATRADEILDRMDTKLAAAANIPWYATPTVKAGAIGEISRQAYSGALSEIKADPVLAGAGSAVLESLARHGMDYVDRGIDQMRDGVESQADTLLGR